MLRLPGPGAQRESSLPASGRGRSPRSPSPPAQPRLNAAAASPRSSCLAAHVTWSNSPGGLARRSVAAPLSCPAGSGESKGPGALRGLQRRTRRGTVLNRLRALI